MELSVVLTGTVSLSHQHERRALTSGPGPRFRALYRVYKSTTANSVHSQFSGLLRQFSTSLISRLHLDAPSLSLSLPITDINPSPLLSLLPSPCLGDRSSWVFGLGIIVQIPLPTRRRSAATKPRSMSGCSSAAGASVSRRCRGWRTTST